MCGGREGGGGSLPGVMGEVDVRGAESCEGRVSGRRTEGESPTGDG